MKSTHNYDFNFNLDTQICFLSSWFSFAIFLFIKLINIIYQVLIIKISYNINKKIRGVEYMDEKQTDLKNTPLASVDDNLIKTNNSNPPFKDIEEQRFTTYNPLLSDNIKFKRMYWSSKIEIIARILLLLVSCLHLVFSYFLANNLVNQILKNIGNNINPNYIIYIFLVITLGFNFLFYLPLAIGRTASAMFGWAVTYIVLAIAYFVVLEIVCTVLLVVNGLVNESVSAEIPIFMVIILLITILWLVAACLLIVKSDDVRRELSVE